MTRHLLAVALIACLCLVMSAAHAADLSPPTVNMLQYQRSPVSPAAQVSESAVQSLAPAGWAVNDMIPCQLDGQGSRELAVVMCKTDTAAQGPNTPWSQIYQGPSKVLIVSEDNVGGGVQAEFEFPGAAPEKDAAANLPSPFFIADLNSDGLPELFVRTREHAADAGDWIHTNAIKYSEGAFLHVGKFGVQEPGGLYFLDVWDLTPGRDVISLHAIWPEGAAQAGPCQYRALIFGWANGYYVPVRDFTTNTKYTTPDPAFNNLRKYLWQR